MTGEPALAALVREQRWFGSKSRTVTGGRIADSGPLPPGCLFALFEAEFDDGDRELYQLPHRVADDGEIVIGLADPPLACALLAALRSSARLPTQAGCVEFELATAALPAEAALEPVRAIGGEQSNSSVVFGERCILKAIRRLESGESPELEMLRFLQAHGFRHAPPLLGWYGYTGTGLTATLGIVQEFAPGARDGWQDALDSLADPPQFLTRLRRLGEVTARMHVVLASAADDPAFQPEERGASAGPGAPMRLSGVPEAVRSRGDDLLERLGELHRLGHGGKAIRQHGDYHLGQVLWTAREDWLVLDFEGEPARPLAERRAKNTPLRDVAGMLRSFAYVAEAGRDRGTPAPPGWECDARAAFLSGYASAIDESLLPPAGEARSALLAACELEKALYELRYELDNRPDWVHVPVAGILRMLDSDEAGR